MTHALQGLTPEALSTLCGAPLAETRKLISAVHRECFDFAPMSGVRRATSDWVKANASLPALCAVDEKRSSIDPFVKFALRTRDKRVLETVRIPLERKGRYSVCVSSQIGCALACAFCATGRMGLVRNLEAWEIVEQVRWVKRTLQAGEAVHGVVFQGMGEPLANLDRVLRAIAVLREPAACGIDARNITVCTSGQPEGIRCLAEQAPKVRLGISFASARSEVRRTLMPIENAHSLEAVLDAAAEHVALTGLSPMWALTLLQGVNDSPDDAHALVARARAFTARTGRKPRLSIIAYNAIAADDDPFARTTRQTEQAFREVLHAAGFPSHRRYSGGSDVGAACGQLATQLTATG